MWQRGMLHGDVWGWGIVIDKQNVLYCGSFNGDYFVTCCGKRIEAGDVKAFNNSLIPPPNEFLK